MMAGTGLPVREVTLTSRHLPRRSGPGHALGRSAPGSVACPPASFHLQPRSPSRMAAVGLAHQRAQTWHLRRSTYRFLSDGWIFLCHSPGQPHLLGTMREQWPLPTFPGLRTTRPQHLKSEATSVFPSGSPFQTIQTCSEKEGFRTSQRQKVSQAGRRSASTQGSGHQQSLFHAVPTALQRRKRHHQTRCWLTAPNSRPH